MEKYALKGNVAVPLAIAVLNMLFVINIAITIIVIVSRNMKFQLMEIVVKEMEKHAQKDGIAVLSVIAVQATISPTHTAIRITANVKIKFTTYSLKRFLIKNCYIKYIIKNNK